MKKILAVLTADPKFSKRFSDYINGTGSLTLRAKPFTQPEEIYEYQKTHGPDAVAVLLRDEALCPENGIAGIFGIPEVLLSETGRRGTLYKYCPASELFSGFLSMCEEAGLSFGVLPQGAELKIYAVWSPCGSLERLFFSLALTRMLSRRKKTIYLDLREFSGLRCLTGKTCDRGLSTAVYYLKQGKLDGLRLMGLLDVYEGISYLSPCASGEDMGVMNAEERSQFFRVLAEESPVECVVADLSDSLAASWDIPDMCERIFLIGSDDPAERESLAAFREMLTNAGRSDLLEKITEVDLSGERMISAQTGIDGVICSKTGDQIRRLLEI